MHHLDNNTAYAPPTQVQPKVKPGNALERDLASGSRFNRWYRLPNYHAEVYARSTQRFINRELVHSLDLAAVEVREEQRGKRNFSTLLAYLEFLALHHNKTLYVESVMNPIVWEALERRGYHREHSTLNSFYRKF